LCRYVGQNKELAVFAVAGDEIDPFVGELDGIVFFVDDKIQGVGHNMHLLVVVLHIKLLGSLHTGFDALLAEVFDQSFVFGHGLVSAVEQQRAFFLFFFVFRGHEFFGLSQQFCGHFALNVDYTLYLGTKFFEELVVALGHRTRNDERGTGIVDQNGVDFVHNGEIVFALHQVERAAGHIVAQVVETEFVVGAKSDVGQISLAPFFGIGAVFVYAIYRQAVKHIERSHPLGVTLGKIIVHRYHVDAVAGEGIQKDGQGGDQGFTFAGGHLGNFTLMQYYTAKELYVVMYHIPDYFVAAG